MEEDTYKSLDGLRILIVEDNEINRALLKSIFSKWKVEVDLAINGKVAVKKVEEKEYDIVLMDINMPEMDGYDATRAIKAKEGDYFSSLPILALTSINTPEYIDEIYECGMTGYIPAKPLDVDRLYRKVSQFRKG